MKRCLRMAMGILATLPWASMAWSAPSESSSVEAAAQSQAARTARDTASPLKARLVDFPPWTGPQDFLRITLDVTNAGQRPAANLRVAFSIYEAVDTRSRLQNTFRGSLGSLLGSDTIPVEGVLEPGATRKITVEKALAEISAVRISRKDGAYPVRIIVRSDVAASNPIETSMIFFTGPPLEPLALSLVIPLHSPSIYGDGYRPRLVTSSSLEKSLSSGRLARILDALEKHPEVPVTLAPSGLLLDMLDDLSGGYAKLVAKKVVRIGPEDPAAQLAARTLARLRLLGGRPATRVIPMPYSAASLGALVGTSLEDLAQSQVVETRTRLSADPGGILGIRSTEGWLLPAYRSLDEPTVSALQRSGVSRIVLSPSSLREVPGALTRAAPLQVKSRTGSVLALVEDDGLKRVLDQPSPDGETPTRMSSLITRQRFLAESATIALERPALKRGVVAVAPPGWAPQAVEIEGLLESLGAAVWMRGATVDSLAALASPTSTPVPLVGPDSPAVEAPQPPSREYFLQLRDARRAIQKFAELAPPPERLVGLQRRLLIAESADWWVSRSSLEKGRRFASAIPVELERQTKSIQAPGAQIITLTSRTGVIPLSVASGLEYPVDVFVKLDSDKLRFPDGNRIPIQKLQSPARTIEVRTIAQATGTFPLRVRVQTATGTVLSEASLTIRSTAYNVMAVSITAGAALFLFAWWIAGWLRRKVAHPA